MRRLVPILLSAAVMLTASAPSPSQSPTTTSQSKDQTNQPDLKISSRLVIVDVVVRKGDHTVPGLQQSDFTLSEDGAQQTIRYFAPHFASDVTNASAIGAPPALPPNTFTNLPVANVTDSVTILLLDGLNTQPSDVQYVRREMISYLKKLPAERRIAVFALGQKLLLLQGFTTDSGLLLAALEKSSSTSPSSLLAPGEATFLERDELG